MRLVLLLALLAAPASSAPKKSAPTPVEGARPASDLIDPRERHFSTLRQLTTGGENAEAYWSWNGRRLVFQQRRGERTCDEMAVMNADGSEQRVIASEGAHTCGFFLRRDRRVLYASTRLDGPACPKPPDRSHGYVWPLLPGYEIFTAKPDGTDVRRLTDSPGYDAEATVSPKDGTIVFTSVRDGDLDIYTMRPDGTQVTRLTDEPGYDGGPVFSPDGSLIVYRAWHPEGDELADYRALLAKSLVRPKRLDLWIMNADGTGRRRVTQLGGASFGPAFTPDGSRIIFSSNHLDPKGREFDLFLVGLDGGALERVTFTPEFDGFPLFSPDGTRLAFCSNRGGSAQGETNVFTAAWRP